MTWTASLAIMGGVLALAPVVLHIIFRRRFVELQWAAMRFVMESLRRSRQRLRIEELVVIALRALTLLLLGLALANPRHSRGESFVPGGPSPSAHVFILDDSFSMGQQVGSGTLFRAAVSHLAERLASLPETDSVAILSAADPVDGHPVRHLASVADLRRQDFARRLTALLPTDSPARFPEAVEAARSLLESQTGLEPRVYVLSDFRARDFKSCQGARAGEAVSGMRPAFGALKADLALLDFGEECDRNLTVEKVELQDRVLAAGVPAQFQATVRNNGASAVEGAALTVESGYEGEAGTRTPGAHPHLPQHTRRPASLDAHGVTEVSPLPQERARVAPPLVALLPAVMLPEIAPGERVTRTFSCAFPEAGYAALRVSVSADALPADNVVPLAVHVKEAVNVLVVDGAANPYDPATSSSRLLSCALDPQGRGERGQRVAVLGPHELTRAQLSRSDFVVLSNVGAFDARPGPDGRPTHPELDMLEEYVREGGGLAVFLGDRVDTGFYNGPLYAGGAGLSPYRLVVREGGVPAVDRAKYRRVRPDSVTDPILGIFTGRTEKFSRLVRFHAHVPVEETAPVALAPSLGAPEVIARLDDAAGSPLAARRSFGAGDVLFWYTSADTRWTDWPKDPSFLPVMNEMVRRYARAAAADLDGLVGEGVSFPLTAELADATGLTMKTPAWPSEDVQSVVPKGDGRARSAVFAGVKRAGVYELEIALPDSTRRTVFFSRRLDPSESDLAKAGAAEIATAVGRPHSYLANLATERSAAPGREEARSYWLWFLLAAAAATMAELVLAQRFGHYAGTGRRKALQDTSGTFASAGGQSRPEQRGAR
jgi:hypothetical protein